MQRTKKLADLIKPIILVLEVDALSEVDQILVGVDSRAERGIDDAAPTAESRLYSRTRSLSLSGKDSGMCPMSRASRALVM